MLCRTLFGWGTIDISKLETKIEEWSLDGDDIINYIIPEFSIDLDINALYFATYDVQAQQIKQRIKKLLAELNIEYSLDALEQYEVGINVNACCTDFDEAYDFWDTPSYESLDKEDVLEWASKEEIIEDKYNIECLEDIENYLESQDIEFEVISEYGDNTLKDIDTVPILLMNLNELENHPILNLDGKINLQYSDEFIIDYDNDRCFRSVSNSYTWEPFYWENNGEIFSIDDINSDIELLNKYSEEYINNPSKAVHSQINLSKLGYNYHCRADAKLFIENDTPTKMVKDLLQNYNVILQIISFQQFGCEYSINISEKQVN
jgi:hypothetical protein